MDHTKPRFHGLDLIKSLGLILVIYYHIVWQYPPDIVSRLRFGDLLAVYFESFLSCCVPLFFMASGALSMNRPPDLRKNSLRCLHLFVLTVFWSVVCLGVVLVLRQETLGLGQFLRYARDTQVGYIQHLWYLPNFLFLSLMVPILQTLRQGNSRMLGYFILLVGFFSFGDQLLNDGEYVLRYLLGKTGYTGYRHFFGYVDFFDYHYWYIFVYFVLGGYLMEHRQTLGRNKGLLVGAILLAMACITGLTVAISRVMGYTYDCVFNNYSSIFTLVISVGVFLLLLDARPGARLRRISRSLATCSLGIYIIHWLIWAGFVRIMPEVMQDVRLAWPMTAVILFLSWGITALALKIPVVGELFTAAPKWAKRFTK